MLDTGAMSSLISEDKCRELNIHIQPTKHKAVQVDGAKLDVTGEIHTVVFRDKLTLTFSALVVRKMGTEALGGTGFHKENDIYSRMATDKIVIQGKYYFNTTPPVALTSRVQVNLLQNTSSIKSPFTFPILVKANRTAVILPGEGFRVPIRNSSDQTTIEIEPRRESPVGFVTNHIQNIEEGSILVENESSEPIKIKKNTPLCQIKELKDVPEKNEESKETTRR